MKFDFALLVLTLLCLYLGYYSRPLLEDHLPSRLASSKAMQSLDVQK